MLKKVSNLGKTISKTDQKSISGGWGNAVFFCTPESEGFTCFSPTTGTDGVGVCVNGECYDC